MPGTGNTLRHGKSRIVRSSAPIRMGRLDSPTRRGSVSNRSNGAAVEALERPV